MRRQSILLSVEEDLLTLISSTVQLAPTQQKTADRLMAAAAKGKVCLLRGEEGMGKTTVMRWLHGRLGGVFVAARQLVSYLKNGRTTGREQTLFVDDVHLVSPASELEAAMASGRHKQFVFSIGEVKTPAGLGRATTHAIGEFKAADYAVICRRYLGESAERLDHAVIYRHAAGLNGHQIKHAALRLGLRYEAPTTGAFMEVYKGVCGKATDLQKWKCSLSV